MTDTDAFIQQNFIGDGTDPVGETGRLRQQCLLRALNESLIPWLKAENAARLLLADPPVDPPPGITVLGYYPAPSRIPEQ